MEFNQLLALWNYPIEVPFSLDHLLLLLAYYWLCFLLLLKLLHQFFTGFVEIHNVHLQYLKIVWYLHLVIIFLVSSPSFTLWGWWILLLGGARALTSTTTYWGLRPYRHCIFDIFCYSFQFEESVSNHRLHDDTHIAARLPIYDRILVYYYLRWWDELMEIYLTK